LRTPHGGRTLAGNMVVFVAKLAALAALLAPVGVVMSTADHSPVKKSDPGLRAPPILWSDRIFLNRPIASGWLAARGIPYDQWAGRHPRAARRLDRAAR
jgi:hypothetical protein